MARPLTLVEKIVARAIAGNAGGNAAAATAAVSSGDYCTIRPHRCMTHDNTAAVMKKFAKAFPDARVHDPRQLVYTLDHNVQDVSPRNLEKYAGIAAFAERHGVDAYPAGRGIGHQVMVEEGYVLPGQMVVASDSHSNMYGGLGASLLSAAGLGALVAGSWTAYEDLAVALSADTPRLEALHRSLLRGRVNQQLAVFDAKRWTRHFAAGLRAAWQRHAVGLPVAGVIDVKEQK